MEKSYTDLLYTYSLQLNQRQENTSNWQAGNSDTVIEHKEIILKKKSNTTKDIDRKNIDV